MVVNIYTDGGSRGNPGISGYGLVIYDSQDKVIYQESKFLGIKTNNEAEYSGLIAALQWIKKNQNFFGISHLNFFLILITLFITFTRVTSPFFILSETESAIVFFIAYFLNL
jgi:spermidine/putrescine-binding protein